MSNDISISIPEEIETFLHTSSTSLLIKGEPGTGKTILALSILKTLKKTHGFYVTTRVKPQTLTLTYPWIMDEIPPDHIIDASRKIFPISTGGEDSKTHFSIIKYSDKPTFLRELYQMLEGKKDSLVIIDSIEGIQEVTSENIYYDLLEIQKEVNSRFIFVSEYEEGKKLDYLVDGVILLKKEISENRFLRELQILKLRGTFCKNHSYIFTLMGGIFRHFEPFKQKTPKEGKRFQPLPDSETHFSTGSEDLDNILGGGYKKGSTVLLELGKNVMREAYFHVLVPTALNFLSQGKKLIAIPSLGTSKETILSAISGFLGEDEMSRIKIVEKRWAQDKLYKTRQELLEDFHYTLGEVLSKVKPESCVISLGLDSLFVKYGDSLIEVLETGIFDIQKKRLLAQWNVKHGTNRIDEIANMVNYHFKIEEKGGVFIFHSLKPRTGTYTIETDFTKGYPQLKLVPIA